MLGSPRLIISVHSNPFLYRVTSRVCVVPFCKPAISASNDEQLDAFDDVEEMIEQHLLSSAVGWIIQQTKVVHDREKKRDVKQKLRSMFKGRSLMNWSIVVLATNEVSLINYPYTFNLFCRQSNVIYFFVKQLLAAAGREDLKDPMMKFLSGLGSTVAISENAGVVRQTVLDILSAVQDMPKHEVCQFPMYSN